MLVMMLKSNGFGRYETLTDFHCLIFATIYLLLLFFLISVIYDSVTIYFLLNASVCPRIRAERPEEELISMKIL